MTASLPSNQVITLAHLFSQWKCCSSSIISIIGRNKADSISLQDYSSEEDQEVSVEEELLRESPLVVIVKQRVVLLSDAAYSVEVCSNNNSNNKLDTLLQSNRFQRLN